MAKLFRRDSKGIARLLKSPEMAAAIRARAERIADVARAETDLEIVVDSYTTDRAAASVTIKDPRGRLLEVRDGILTRAVTAVGMEIGHK